jgi:hypothetical protein
MDKKDSSFSIIILKITKVLEYVWGEKGTLVNNTLAISHCSLVPFVGQSSEPYQMGRDYSLDNLSFKFSSKTGKQMDWRSLCAMNY